MVNLKIVFLEIVLFCILYCATETAHFILERFDFNVSQKLTGFIYAPSQFKEDAFELTWGWINNDRTVPLIKAKRTSIIVSWLTFSHIYLINNTNAQPLNSLLEMHLTTLHMLKRKITNETSIKSHLFSLESYLKQPYYDFYKVLI